MIIGNGNKTNFWDEVWSQNSVLIDQPQIRIIKNYLSRKWGEKV